MYREYKVSMRILVPITGTVINDNPVVGDPDDPIRLINVNLGNVSWKLVRLDLGNDMAEIEVTPGAAVSEETGELDAESKPVYRVRPTTKAEKDQALAKVRDLINRNTAAELYAMSKSARLKKPFKGEK